jgi:hypothetical protein
VIEPPAAPAGRPGKPRKREEDGEANAHRRGCDHHLLRRGQRPGRPHINGDRDRQQARDREGDERGAVEVPRTGVSDPQGSAETSAAWVRRPSRRRGHVSRADADLHPALAGLAHLAGLIPPLKPEKVTCLRGTGL